MTLDIETNALEIPIKYKISDLIKPEKITFQEYGNNSLKIKNDLDESIKKLEEYYNGMYLEDKNLSIKYAEKYLNFFNVLYNSKKIIFPNYFIEEYKKLKLAIEDIKKEKKVTRKIENLEFDTKNYIDGLVPINNIKQ